MTQAKKKIDPISEAQKTLNIAAQKERKTVELEIKEFEKSLNQRGWSMMPTLIIQGNGAVGAEIRALRIK